MKDDEHKHQCAYFRWLEYQYPFEYLHTYAIPNGGHRHISVAKKLKAEGVKPGVPDIFMAVPKKGYHGLYIEMKANGNKVTDNQREWIERLNRQRYVAVVCDGVDEAMIVTKSYLL